MMKSKAANEARGFSLVELVIAMAIVGLLASVAYPQYTEYLRRAARADAMIILLDAANKQEQYYVDNRQYTETLADLGVVTTTDKGYFTITSKVVDNSFTLTATAVGGPVLGDTQCTTLTINDLGVKGSTGTLTRDDCWER